MVWTGPVNYPWKKKAKVNVECTLDVRVNSECELHLDLRYVSLALFKVKKKVPIYCALSNCSPP